MTTDPIEEKDEPGVVVTIDAVAQLGPAIELAAALARVRQRALHGLFIEDEDLLRVSQLPFSQEVMRFGGQSRNLSNVDLQRVMSRLAREFQHALAKQAESFSLRWSYRSERGSKRVMTPAGYRPAELVIIGQPLARSRLSRARERILLFDGANPEVQQALGSILQARGERRIDVIEISDSKTAPDGALLQMLHDYPGTTVQRVRRESLESLLAATDSQLSLVVLSTETDAADIEPCLRLARCPIILAPQRETG